MYNAYHNIERHDTDENYHKHNYQVKSKIYPLRKLKNIGARKSRPFEYL